MQNSDRVIGWGVFVLAVIVLLYYIWPYLVGGLALVGALQVYRVWRNHIGR